MTPKQEAHAWWEARVSSGRYTGPRSDLPGTAVLRILRDDRLIAETPGGWAWVALGSETPDPDQALRHNYWQLVGVALTEYRPAEISRISAVRLFVGDTTIPPTLHVLHGASESKRRLVVADGFVILLLPNPVAGQAPTGGGNAVRVRAGDVDLSASSAERTLVSLTARDVREHRDLILSWLRSLIVAQSALETVYAAHPRHVLMARMGHLARDLGNFRLADQIGRVLAGHHRHRVSRVITGVGDNFVVPEYITASSSTRDPGLDRLQARISRAALMVDDLVSPVERTLSFFAEGAVIRVARAAKLEDTYHSTTIEGYRITEEEVRAVVEGLPYQGRTPDEITRLMALKGYSQAFDRTLALIHEAFGQGGPVLSEDIIFDLYVALWGPSIDAGIVTAADMRGWRETPVFIRQSRHVPPAPEKVGRYMAQFLDLISTLSVGPISRAILTHWGFVHIHPFMDGNGRLARLLMNYILAGSGLPWTTIRAEERSAYFMALEHAHVDEDVMPFAEFLLEGIQRSVQERS